MRRQIDLKSSTCTESMEVDAAGISVKVGAHYPGRSALNSGQKSAKGIVSPVFLAGTKA
jgi:hypothetical protein